MKQPPLDGMAVSESLYSSGKEQTDSKLAIPTNISNYYVLEFSPSQGAFHIEKLHQMISSNAKSFTRGRLNDYSPIAISKDRQRLERAIERFRQRGK